MHYIIVISYEEQMPKIHAIGAIEIVIYFNEHGVPHVHAIAAEFEAKIAIEDAMVIAGSLPHAQLRQVRRWVLANQTSLIEKWNQYTDRK